MPHPFRRFHEETSKVSAFLEGIDKVDESTARFRITMAKASVSTVHADFRDTALKLIKQAEKTVATKFGSIRPN